MTEAAMRIAEKNVQASESKLLSPASPYRRRAICAVDTTNSVSTPFRLIGIKRASTSRSIGLTFSPKAAGEEDEKVNTRCARSATLVSLTLSTRITSAA